MSHAVAPETMGAYVLRKVLASPPMVEVSGTQACIDPRRRRGDAGGTARSHVEPGQVVIQKHAPLLHSMRSEEHTSELQSHSDLVCRLLLEKKKNTTTRRLQCTSTMIARRTKTIA